jgi:hypothetical protein
MTEHGGEAPLGLPCFDDPLGRVPPCDDPLERPVPGPRPACPDSEPSAGAPCAMEGLVCGYGDAPLANCRNYFACAGGSWTLDARLDSDRFPCEPPADYCPPEAPSLRDPCTAPPGLVTCVYDDVLCNCVSGQHWATDGAQQWLCYGPPDDPDCPETLPNLGEGCATPGVQCSYVEDCEFPPYSTVFCFGDAWEEGYRGTPCLP